MNKTEKIFHGCFTKNKDGTNRLIKKRERCLVPTSNPFWNNQEDIESCGANTRSQEKNKKKSQNVNTINTINKKIFRDGWRQKIQN